MITTTCTCDKCGKQITDVFYTLTCYAQCVPGENPGKHIDELALQNIPQNKGLALIDRHLCRECKDTVTDGLFII